MIDEQDYVRKAVAASRQRARSEGETMAEFLGRKHFETQLRSGHCRRGCHAINLYFGQSDAMDCPDCGGRIRLYGITSTQVLALFDAATRALGEGRVEEATELLEDAIKLDPSFGNAQYQLSEVAMRNGHFEKALEHASRAIESDETDALAYGNRGAALAGLGRFSEATVDFAKAVELLPDFGMGWLNLGVVQAKHGRWNDARRSWERVVHLEANTPLGTRAREFLARIP